MARIATLDASVVKIKGSLKSGKANTGTAEPFKLSKASFWVGPHVNYWSFLVSVIRGFASLAKSGTSLL
jgi:hypothetical protein